VNRPWLAAWAVWGLAEHDHGVPRVDRHDRRAEGDVWHGIAEDRGDGQCVVVELLGQPQRAKADLNSYPAEGDEGVHLVGGGRLLGTGGQYSDRARQRGLSDVVES